MQKLGKSRVKHDEGYVRVAQKPKLWSPLAQWPVPGSLARGFLSPVSAVRDVEDFHELERKLDLRSGV